jgi:very-short-patch-repair endonuclease/predicted DNA-binding protein YlxM (UPF0122 family)
MPNQFSVITEEIKSLLPKFEELLKKGYSLNEICQKYEKYSYSGIYNCIKRNGLANYISTKNIGKSRTSKKRNEEYNNNHKLNKHTLEKLYWEDKLDLYEIAKLFNLSPSGVYYRIRKYNIKTRNRSDASKLMYEKKPELREVHRNNANIGKTGIFKKGNNYSNTWIEREFQRYCEENELKYERSFQITKNTHRYDFLVGNKTIVELDGLYWHNKPKQKNKDKLHEEFARQNGYSVIRFTDKQIKETKGECFKIIRIDER